MQKALLRLTLLLIILLALAGCGDRQPTPVAATPAAQQATPTAAPDQEKAAPADTQAVGGEPALTVEQVASIETYRMRVDVTSEGKPSIVVEVAHVKTPLAEDDQVTLYQNDQPTTVDVRYVNDVLYLNNGEKWTVISTFNLAELTVVTPAGLAGAAPDMTLLGEEEISGRKTLHLHGDKNVIPDIQTGSDSLSVKNADDAQLDLWLDAEERFIVKLFFSLTLEGKTFTTEFLYYDFNAPIVVEAPTNVEAAAKPPTPMPSEIVALLGFDFPIPEGSRLSVVERTVNILTQFSVAEARAYLEDAMTTAGFAQSGEPLERTKDEFFYIFQQGDQTVTATVFSVEAGKATIQIGAAK